jgi:alpha-L-arabinofuranosidase
MPTYLEWDREVLEQCYDYVDALSLHRYVGNTPEETGGDSGKYLALNLTMDRQIEETLAVATWCGATSAPPRSSGCHSTSGMFGTARAAAKQ